MNVPSAFAILSGAACFLAGSALAPSAPAPIKLNQIQVIGTHNSYHAGISPSMGKWLQEKNPEAFAGRMRDSGCNPARRIACGNYFHLFKSQWLG